MPGIERLREWVRLVLYWLLFSLTLTAVLCLLLGKTFTAQRLLLVAVIVGATTAVEQLWIRRRRRTS